MLDPDLTRGSVSGLMLTPKRNDAARRVEDAAVAHSRRLPALQLVGDRKAIDLIDQA